MPHVPVSDQLPGIVGLFAFRPETAGPLQLLAETLLRGESTLTRGERELIAAWVSSKNTCEFCCGSHSAFAAAQLPGGRAQVEAALVNPGTADLSPKMVALLDIAAQVQQSGRAVQADAIARARAEGATDVEIHDTVLIAAAFCMFNRYVDGLATVPAPSRELYDASAQMIVAHGYVQRPA